MTNEFTSLELQHLILQQRGVSIREVFALMGAAAFMPRQRRRDHGLGRSEHGA